jgi:hypothetical protein
LGDGRKIHVSTGLDFSSIPPGPAQVSGGAVLTCLVAGIGFRFYWVTEGLRDEDIALRVIPEAMSIAELTVHVLELAEWVAEAAVAIPKADGTPNGDPAFPENRRRALEMLALLRDRFSAMRDEEISAIRLPARAGGLPWPHIINGPLADALTHVGQINLLRRASGNPVPKANVLLGQPPKVQ